MPLTLEACLSNNRSRLLGSWWLDWLLPPRCGSCRTLGAWLCDRCRARIRFLEEPLCPRCGREVEFSGADCGCRSRLRALWRARSVAVYEGPLEEAIHRFKYDGWRALAPALAELCVDRLAAEVPLGAGLTAVPLHRRRRRARGYNQSELLATELRRRLGLPRLLGRLTRVRDTPPQVGLDRLRRRANVAAAFAWQGPQLAGEPVVLLDDVTTTGATLEACAAALRAGGSGPVLGFTVARVLL
jgi:ComF family protein